MRCRNTPDRFGPISSMPRVQHAKATMVENIVTNAMAEKVSTVGCSTKLVEYSQAIAGSIATPEIRQNMNMKLTGWIFGRQRSEAEYTAHRIMLMKMMMS